MLYFMALALSLGLGVPIAVLGAGLGQGKAAAAAMEGMARQPELAGRIQTAMILALAFIESLVIFSLLVFFLMNAHLPDTKVIEGAVTTAASAGK
jgi:F-type H+-transporting ATPase subunit c